MSQQRYQVIERIDAGGMAEVFKASSTSMQGFQKLVAIKRILPSLTQDERFVRMFLDEAKVSLHLNHTNIVQVFDLGIADDTYFIVMEFVEGTNLKKYLQFFREQQTRIPIEQAVFVAIEICKGLTHAHEQYDQNDNHLGIVHRDISPPNVLLSMSGEVKLTDFGLAKAKSQVEVTDPGVVKGKFGYLSPEAARGEEVDARTDIFAVGILLWEMLAGKRLFLGQTDHETLQMVQSAPIPPLRSIVSDIPEQLEQIIHTALARDVHQRYQSAAQFGQELAQFLFSYGRVVTNYTIGELVREIGAYEKRHRSSRERAVSEAVQREVNRIMSLESLEQIRDLDPYLAEHYHSAAHDNEELSVLVRRAIEDPRRWNDLGFPEEGSQHDYPLVIPPDFKEAQSNTWREGGLERLIHSQSNGSRNAIASLASAHSDSAIVPDSVVSRATTPVESASAHADLPSRESRPLAHAAQVAPRAFSVARTSQNSLHSTEKPSRHHLAIALFIGVLLLFVAIYFIV